MGSRTQDKRVGRLLTENLADAVTATKQALESNWEQQTHCKLWATPPILLRTPLSTGEDETNPRKSKNPYGPSSCRKMQIPRGSDWETLARQAKQEKMRMKLEVEGVRNQMEAQSEEAAQLKKGISSCTKNKKWKHERRDAGADRRRSR